MHTDKDTALYVLSFDLDRTVSPPNQPIQGIYKDFLTELQKVAGVEVVLNSGKAVRYLEDNAAHIGGRYVIANNGAVCHIIGGDPIVFGGGTEEIVKLKKLLGLGEEDEGVKPINLANKTFDVAVEEGKHNLVLTLFTEPEPVKHRYQFSEGPGRFRVYEEMQELIKKHNLNLYALYPHGDSAVDIVRLHEGSPIDKSTLPEMVKQVWEGVDVIKIAMFGDGSNDVPAMTAKGIVGVTFADSDEEKVKRPVLQHNGIVTHRAAWIKKDNHYAPAGGPIEGIIRLAELGFFDDKKTEIIQLAEQYLAQVEIS